MFYLLILLSICLLAKSDSCTTPNGQEGECILINKCPQLYNLLTENMSSATRKYLKSSHCGFENKFPKVCCPLGSPLPPSHTNITTRLNLNKECGLTLASKIFGGVKTEIDEFPWTALLEYKNSKKIYFGCAGTLISQRFVLTAKHCLHRNLIKVRLGEWKISTNPDCRSAGDCAPEVLKVGIEKQIYYQDKTSRGNDIGLIKLTEDVDYNDYIKPICLPTNPEDLSRNYINQYLVVVGWGLTEKNESSDIKLKVSIPVKPLSDCESGLRNAYHVDFTLHDTQICAGGEPRRDSCNGDSGGPLMYLGNNSKWYIVGITSFGTNDPCGSENKPAVYVNVAKYVKWITDNIES